MARRVVDLGPVDAYAIAVAEGYTGTREEWVQAMANAEANGLKAEGYAVGEQNGTPVTSGEYFENNAKYYNEQAQSAKEDAETAQTAAETARTAAETAQTAAETAQTAAETAAARDTAAWLNEHITNPNSPPLDRTLMSSSAAAPADMVGDLKSALKINEKQEQVPETINITSTWTSGYINAEGSKTEPHNSYDYSESISVQTGDIITIGSGAGTDTLRFVCAYNNGAVESEKGSSSNSLSYTVPSGVDSVIISASKTVQDKTIHILRIVSKNIYYVDGQINPDTFYVSTSGDDDNNGLSPQAPKATINNALESGAETILMFSGVYAQTIDLTKCQHPSIRIAAYEKNKKSVIKAPDAVLTDSAEQVSGYTKVFSTTCGKTFDTNNIWIFQDGVADASTAITTAERHPLQRGYQYRCADTKIVKATATVLADALTEIETSEDYKWFIDNGTIYFSCPSAVSVNNPICWSSGTELFSGNSKGMAIEMVGIDSKYLIVNLNDAMSANIENCSSGNVYGNGCFVYDGVASARFTHCEAYRGFKGTNGDGFNAHGVTTGDTFARQTYGLFLDCWSHDNQDDGISDHERCESCVIGGLFEYNRYGGGVTPSYGSHCTCNGVYCRKNGDGGFLYMDSASVAEGGVGGQLICYNCVAEANTLWPEHKPSGYKINGDNNLAILVNCKSIGQDYGYYITNVTTFAKLIDCGALDCGHVTGGRNDNFTKTATTIVS